MSQLQYGGKAFDQPQHEGAQAKRWWMWDDYDSVDTEIHMIRQVFISPYGVRIQVHFPIVDK